MKWSPSSIFWLKIFSIHLVSCLTNGRLSPVSFGLGERRNFEFSKVSWHIGSAVLAIVIAQRDGKCPKPSRVL